MAIERLSCPFPDNITPLSSGGFMLSIQKAPNVKFWCNQANLPGMNLGSATLSSPFSQVNTPGETIAYDPLSVQFLIDSDMSNYYELWNWMYSLGFPENWDDFANFTNADNRNLRGTAAKLVSDASLTILNNSNNPVKTIQFIDLFPVNLTSLQMQANNSDVVYLTGEATFNYSHWKFVD